MTTRVCDVEGCGRPHRARGLCDSHYRRWRKEHPEAPKRIRAENRAGAVDRLATHAVEVDGHLIWRGQLDQGVMPRVASKLHSTGNYRVWLWEELHGPLDGYVTVFARESCPVGCVSPEHLLVARRDERSWGTGPRHDRSQLDYELLRTLAANQGNRSATARELRMNRVQLVYRLKVLREWLDAPSSFP